MTTQLGWPEILLRLALTLVAGFLIGLNRGEHGRPAGLRTTLLVSLAASISMIQANLLLGTVGKAGNSFIVLDLMRLPLGILSGMGFIGAGAILHKGDIVAGVTTAATLWFVTVMGLCFGGGQLMLGLIAMALAFVILTALKKMERQVTQESLATVHLKLDGGSTDEEMASRLRLNGFSVSSWRVHYFTQPGIREVRFVVRWPRRPADVQPPALIAELAGAPGVLEVEWKG